ALSQAASGVARIRSGISHLRGGQPLRSKDRSTTVGGVAADRVAPSHGYRLGYAPDALSVAQSPCLVPVLAAGHCAGRVVFTTSTAASSRLRTSYKVCPGAAGGRARC